VLDKEADSGRFDDALQEAVDEMQYNARAEAEYEAEKAMQERDIQEG
jgi:hypothetical protein